MNTSAFTVVLVPPAVVTVTATGPAEAEGDTAVNDDALVYDTDAAALVPNSTVEPAVNPVPLITTDVPPTNGPSSGLIPVTAGIGS